MLVWLLTGQLPFKVYKTDEEGMDMADTFAVTRIINAKHDLWVRFQTCCHCEALAAPCWG